MKKKQLAATCLAIAALLGTPRAEIIEQVLLKVNGEIFTKTDLEARQIAVLRQRLGQQVDLKNRPTDAQLRKMLDEITPRLVVDVVDEMLVLQRGRELGYKLSDEQFKTYLDSIKKDNKIESDDQLQAALKQENMTMADLRRNIENQMIMSRVQQSEVLGRITVPEVELRQFYQARVNDFTTPQAVELREVFVSVPEDAAAGSAAEQTARQKAEQVHTRALKGDSFEKLAADLSDAPSRANAGLIGPFSLTDLSPELRKMIEGMKVGAVSSMLRTPRGYQILKLESSTPPETMSFEQAREQISERLFNEKRAAEMDKYLEKLRADAIIEWKNADVRKAYDAGVEQIKAAGRRPVESASQ